MQSYQTSTVRQPLFAIKIKECNKWLLWQREYLQCRAVAGCNRLSLSQCHRHLWPNALDRSADHGINLRGRNEMNQCCSENIDNLKRIGRAHYHCPVCNADVSFEAVLIYMAEYPIDEEDK
jgi:hypothetical protein